MVRGSQVLCYTSKIANPKITPRHSLYNTKVGTNRTGTARTEPARTEPARTDTNREPARTKPARTAEPAEPNRHEPVRFSFFSENGVVTKTFAPKFCAEWSDREVHSSHGDYFRDRFCVYVSGPTKINPDPRKCRHHENVRAEILCRMVRSRGPQLPRGLFSWPFQFFCFGTQKLTPIQKNIAVTKTFAPKFCAEWSDREVHSSYGDYFRDHFYVYVLGPQNCIQ